MELEERISRRAIEELRALADQALARGDGGAPLAAVCRDRNLSWFSAEDVAALDPMLRRTPNGDVAPMAWPLLGYLAALAHRDPSSSTEKFYEVLDVLLYGEAAEPEPAKKTYPSIEVRPAPDIHRSRRRKDDSLIVLAEDSAFGRRLADWVAGKDKLHDGAAPGRNVRERVGLDVRVILAPYQQMLEMVALFRDQQVDRLESEAVYPHWDYGFDLLACQHHDLFRELKEAQLLQPLGREAASVLDDALPFWSSDRFRHKTQDGPSSMWLGAPAQFPVKVVCFRPKFFPDGLPRSMPALRERLHHLRKEDSQTPCRGIALQGRLGDPALYYEWQAFVQAQGGADVVWDPWDPEPRVALAEDVTLQATAEFLELFHSEFSDPKHQDHDWYSVFHAMATEQIALSLPFSDVVDDLLRVHERVNGGDELRFAPLQFVHDDSLPYEGIEAGRFQPALGLTSHVLVSLNPDEVVRERASRFIALFLEEEKHQRFLSEVLMATHVIDVDIPETMPESRKSALQAARISSKYVLPNVSGEMPAVEFDLKSDKGLNRYQTHVLDAISELLKRKDIDRDWAREVEPVLKRCAARLAELVAVPPRKDERS